MTRFAAALVLVLATSVAHAEPRTVGQPVVYGADDRVPVEDHDDAGLRAVAESSVAAIVDESRLSELVDGETLGEREALCPGERFAELPSVARCTAVLVADDLVMTAGHCVENVGACRSRAFVFGWFTRDGELRAPEDSQVYRCAEVIVADTRGYANLELDYAVVRLDRPVEGGLAPVQIRSEAALVGEPVVLISHPSGIPMTIDAGGTVVDARAGERDYFVVDTDSFEGSSGGPVLDRGGALLGILVRGAADYVEADGCRAVNTLSVGEEEVTHVEWALRSFCRERRTHPLCATRDACGVSCVGACAEICEPPEPPPGWSCVDEVYGTADGCDCGCDAPDPDCESAYDRVYGCPDSDWCDEASTCVPAEAVLPPEGWECNPVRYSDAVCDCDCGVDDVACSPTDCVSPRPRPERCATGRGGGALWVAFALCIAARRSTTRRRRR